MLSGPWATAEIQNRTILFFAYWRSMYIYIWRENKISYDKKVCPGMCCIGHIGHQDPPSLSLVLLPRSSHNRAFDKMARHFASSTLPSLFTTSAIAWMIGSVEADLVPASAVAGTCIRNTIVWTQWRLRDMEQGIELEERCYEQAKRKQMRLMGWYSNDDDNNKQ